MTNTVYNQDIIDGTYNPDFLNNAITTEADEEADFNDPNALEEIDSAVLITALQKLLARFRCLEAIPEQHLALQPILDLTGLPNWEEVKTYYSDEVQTVFGDTKKSQTNSIENRRLTLCQSLFARVDKDFQSANNELAGIEAAIAKLNAAKEQAETTKVLNEYTPGKEAAEATAKANATLAMAAKQLPTLTAAAKAARAKRARLIAEHDLAKARIQAAESDNMLIVNTGDPSTDAEVYAKVASNICWKIASLNNAIAVARSQLDPANGEMRYSIREIESTGGGLYEGTIDRITRLEQAKALQITLYAAAEFGFELCTDARDNESTWWPTFTPLWTGVQDAQRRINAGSVRKAQERARAVASALDNGY